jgi:hypothetical protein
MLAKEIEQIGQLRSTVVGAFHGQSGKLIGGDDKLHTPALNITVKADKVILQSAGLRLVSLILHIKPFQEFSHLRFVKDLLPGKFRGNIKLSILL